MNVYIGLYKGKGTLINKIVRWWTKSKYSHAELVLPNNVTWIGISPFLSSKVESRFHLDYEIIYHLSKGHNINLNLDTEIHDPLSSVWYVPHNIPKKE